MGTVVDIHRVEIKHGPACHLETAHFIADFGLEGDWRSRKGRNRQITLIEAEPLEAVAAMLKLPAIPPGASRRQVVVRGIALNSTVGKQIRIGSVLIQVHGLCEPCKRMETTIGPDAWRAMNDRGGVIGRVLEGGTIRSGDQVDLIQ